MWSSHAEQVVTQLIAELSAERRDPTVTHAARLGALPIGCDMWSDYYLRPNGDVVIVGEDLRHPDVDSVHRDHSRLMSVLVWGSERYPQLKDLIPARPDGATDCECKLWPEWFIQKRLICGTCGGVGWIPKERHDLAGS